MSIATVLLVVVLATGCNCAKFRLSELLPSNLRSEWCSNVPELHFFAESADMEDTYVKQFQTSITSLSSNSKDSVVVEPLGGDHLEYSYIYCNEDENFLCHGWDDEKHIDAGGYWKEPPDELKVKECGITLSIHEDVLFFTNFFSNNYGHFLHDNFPGMMMFYALREKLTNNPKAKLMVPLNPISRRFLKWAMLELKNDIITYRKKQKICIIHRSVPTDNTDSTDSNKLPFVHIMHFDSPTNIFNIRSPYISSIATTAIDNILHRPHTINKQSILTASPMKIGNICQERYVVYYSRAPAANMHHGRPVENNPDVVNTIQRAMDRYNRSEKLILFTGIDYTMRSQYELFRCASVVIGPHGSGLGNAMWTPHSENCQEPVHVIEVTCGSRCPDVHTSCPYNRNYFCLTGGLPWGKYHLMVLTPNSTNGYLWMHWSCYWMVYLLEMRLEMGIL